MILGSFSFNGINSVEKYGIYCVDSVPFIPPKRERKIKIPGRHGSYDYGSDSYDDIGLRLVCSCLPDTSRATLREISHWLSEKGRLILWDEEDKYYIGELYDGPRLSWKHTFAMDSFVLNFACEPFAYKDKPAKNIIKGSNSIGYAGTAEAPFVISISNPNAFPISNVQFTIIKKDGVT